MLPPIQMLTLAVMAGVGLGMGIYYLLHDMNEEERSSNRSGSLQSTERRTRHTSPARWSPPAERSLPMRQSLPVGQSSPRPTRQVTASTATCQSLRSLPSQVASTSSNVVRRRTIEPVENCKMCKAPMRNSTINAECGHIFHMECYDIWKAVMIELRLNKMCPDCAGPAAESL